ncbi:MAG: hypothetical protein A2Z91_03735 [Deltaproteobacteria bacterium GWA2_38_16]|nr:MAG: hypothetical protein A2Z91_03735 [Deltaproteobacteria bacterium GWA2_38_16]OGQ02144.1 MAG: hypothetical protein A3D19_00455 [Deltaproteobacteria bacterium RIFCSPHIGHO2_02_FULL_38_15]OGQ34195.1 MAG: hypothetical protein A3A72_02810 [Deltaproteobacteria bacterium RIFCSPLOWO2_01_FULL_38_9]OGQ60574.1 MAG: hypothetical protein A3G92_01635 [Deltaproteobacteria bacterium RIFCSPLOWO2_12_FULL_38_8]
MEEAQVLKRMQRKEQRRRKRERIIIVTLSLFFAALTYAEIHLTSLGGKLPFISSVLFFALINVNIIIIGLLIFLVFRNVIKLFWERHSRILGSKLKTKLVVVFVSFALIPSILLFTISAFYIDNSFGKWFSFQLTNSIQDALDVHNNYYQTLREKGFHFGDNISSYLLQQKLLKKNQRQILEIALKNFQKDYALDAIEIFSNLEGKGIATRNPDFRQKPFPPLEQSFLKEGFLGRQASIVQHVKEGDLVRCVMPVYEDVLKKKVIAALVISSYVSPQIVEKVAKINSTYNEYREVKPLKKSLKAIYFTLLLLMTLLIIFTAVWLGFHLARELTIPIQRLVEGTQEVAQRNLDVQIQYEGKDELSMLVRSFNKMTQDLKGNSQKLALAYAELQKTNTELGDSSRYSEAILKNIKAGVVSVNSQGMITTINKAAEELLGIKAYKYMGTSYQKVLPLEYLKLVEEMLQESPEVSEHTVGRQIKIQVQGKDLTLLVSVTMMRDEDGKYLGMVLVLDNLTDLIKAQRVAAWREVARRIAHEIKNPLTPIKLSAQRLRRKYLSSADQVFDECTKMIITQVDELKELVNEFSQFAKLPEANPRPSHLQAIVKEALTLYQEAHKHIIFEYVEHHPIPLMELDREQMKRVFINIFDNAVSAISGKGRVAVEVRYYSALQLVIIEISDSGSGISEEVKSRLFEPYFSTKKEGTGLGLSIVRKIISDHQGYIRVTNHKPQGTKFIIELPITLTQREPYHEEKPHLSS